MLNDLLCNTLYFNPSPILHFTRSAVTYLVVTWPHKLMAQVTKSIY